MITRHHVVAILAFVAGVAPGGMPQVRDNAPTSSALATVSGTVRVADPSKQPGRRVRVTLNEVNGRVPGQTTTTDDAGVFTFTGVAAGRFELQAFRNGFLRASYGASRPERPGTPVVVREGEAVRNLMLTIAPGGVIGGTVRDRQGQPLADVDVRVMRLGYSATTGEPTLSVPANSTISRSDDRGEYRAFGLPPGGYIVLALPGPGRGMRGYGERIRVLTTAEVQSALQAARSGGAAPRMPTAAENPGAFVSYTPIFHPGVSDISRAATLALGISEERTGVDLEVELVPTSTVSGRISSTSGPIPPALSIVVAPTGPTAGMLAATGVTGMSGTPRPDGTFSISGVLPGSYTVRARAGGGVGRGAPADGPTISGAADITVDGRDLEVAITLRPGVPITGRVVFEGASPTPAELQAMAFQLVPVGAGGTSPSSGGGRVTGTSQFTFAGVPPDAYYLQTNWTAPGASARWTIKTATANGRDVYEAPMRVLPDRPVDLTVTFTDRPSIVSGVFQDRTGRAATDYFVVVFSADRAHWVPGSRRIRTARPATDGTFDVRGLPAGEYLMGALTDLDPGEWNDPTLLAELAKLAIKVTVRDAQTTTQDIRIGG